MPRAHCYENFVCNDEVKVIVDVSGLDQVSWDEQREAYCLLGAGATNWRLDTHLYRRFGVAVPGGSCYSVGVGGHISAGGFGLLSRQWGLTVDYLQAVEVVVVGEDGKPRHTARGAQSGRWQADPHRRRAASRSGSGAAALPGVTTCGRPRSYGLRQVDGEAATMPRKPAEPSAPSMTR